MSTALALLGALACTKSSAPAGPIQLSTPRVRAATALSHLTTKHGQGGREVPVRVDGESCELPRSGAHAALQRVAAQLCEVKPEGFHLVLELDAATSFGDVVELFAADPRPESCRMSVMLDATTSPRARDCDGALPPEHVNMTPWPPTVRVRDPGRH